MHLACCLSRPSGCCMSLVGFMILLEAVVIPLYHILYRLDLDSTMYWALILPQIGLSVSFGTLWMSNFFRTAPQELIDAAGPTAAAAGRRCGWCCRWRAPPC